MTNLHFHRCSRALVAAVLVVSGIAIAAPPVAASIAPSVATTCGPKVSSHQAAPGVGNSATYPASFAGSVTLLQQSKTTLKVKSVSPKSGWLDTVVTGSGTTVHVGFQKSGAAIEQERFWARLNSTGTVITTVLQSCT
jgi:hypothetical protein